MYKYNLIISIFSEDKNLENIIQEIKPIENFTYEIKSYNSINIHAIADSDIIIWDFEGFNLNKIKQNCKKDVKLILCGNEYTNELDIIDGIIQKPFNNVFIKFYIEKILKEKKTEEDLYYTNTILNTAINSLPDMFWVKTIDGIHVLVNNSFCKTVDKEKEDIIGHDHCSIWGVSPDDPNSGADICKKTEDEVISKGNTLSFSESVKGPDGKRQLTTYKSPVYDKNGKVLGTVGFGRDITTLENLNKENDLLLNSMSYGILIRDNKGNIQNINSAFEEYFEILKEKIINTQYSDWANKTFLPNRRTNREGYIEGVTYSINGEMKVFELRSTDIHDTFGNVTGQVCIFRDVTKERMLEEQLTNAAYKDELTKLYNRRYLDKFILELENGEYLNLFSIDLDHFKSVNDNYGHKVGDEALVLTSNILKNCFNGNPIVRMGGDEFLIVKVGNFDIDDLKNEAQNLLNDLNNNFNNDSRFTNLSASIGITQGTLDNNIDDLMKQSDDALYESKKLGRARYSVYEKKQLVKKL